MNALVLLASLAIAGVDYSAALVEGGGQSLPADSGSTAHDVPGPAQEASGLLSPGSVVAPALTETATEPSIKTGQCQCQSRGERACYCLKTGNKCYCPTRGPSTWELTEAGAPIRKVQKPSRREASAGDVTAPAAAAINHQQSTPNTPRLEVDGKWWWMAPDGVHWWAESQPKSGDVVTDGKVTWDCVNGAMVQRGSKMAADIAPKKEGHWETYTVCHGNYCTTHRRWVKH